MSIRIMKYPGQVEYVDLFNTCEVLLYNCCLYGSVSIFRYLLLMNDRAWKRFFGFKMKILILIFLAAIPLIVGLSYSNTELEIEKPTDSSSGTIQE